MAPSEAQRAQGYRGLLALVIILGALILLSVGALIAAAILRAGGTAERGEPYRTAIGAPGQRVDSAEIDGNRILLRLSGAGGEELVVIDLGSGRVIGRIAIAASP